MPLLARSPPLGKKTAKLGLLLGFMIGYTRPAPTLKKREAGILLVVMMGYTKPTPRYQKISNHGIRLGVTMGYTWPTRRQKKAHSRFHVGVMMHISHLMSMQVCVACVTIWKYPRAH